VHVQATLFVENPILSWLNLRPHVAASELRLPFGQQRLAPIAGYDVAELCAMILTDSSKHVGKAYALTGPDLKDMNKLANDYAAVLGRPVTSSPRTSILGSRPTLKRRSALASPTLLRICRIWRALSPAVATTLFRVSWRTCSGESQSPCSGRSNGTIAFARRSRVRDLVAPAGLRARPAR
jgi:uncharacterized protein YbjT (DUF2867 family)